MLLVCQLANTTWELPLHVAAAALLGGVAWWAAGPVLVAGRRRRARHRSATFAMAVIRSRRRYGRTPREEPTSSRCRWTGASASSSRSRSSATSSRSRSSRTGSWIKWPSTLPDSSRPMAPSWPWWRGGPGAAGGRRLGHAGAAAGRGQPGARHALVRLAIGRDRIEVAQERRDPDGQSDRWHAWSARPRWPRCGPRASPWVRSP